MEGAIKMARQYFLELKPAQPQRRHFISRQESYHGATLGALSVGGHRGRRALFEPLLIPNTSRVSPCNEYRGRCKTESVKDFVARLADELEMEFQRVGPDTVCAFIAEPVVGAVSLCLHTFFPLFALHTRMRRRSKQHFDSMPQDPTAG